MDISHLISPQRIEADLAQNLRSGLLPDRFLYVGTYGAASWVDLDRSRSFQVASSLHNLLAEELENILGCLPVYTNLAGIGVGSGEKERLILQGLLEQQAWPAYFPTDISPELVRMAMCAVADLPIPVHGFTTGIDEIPDLAERFFHPLLVSLLGNTFCNYLPKTFFGALETVLHSGDSLLLDCHLFQDGSDHGSIRDEIKSAYHSPINTRFNLNPLVSRGVPEEACFFDLQLVTEETEWGQVLRTRKTITILEDVDVRCGNETVSLASGAVLGMGLTYKYTVEQVRLILADFGFRLVHQRLSDDGANLLILATPYKA